MLKYLPATFLGSNFIFVAFDKESYEKEMKKLHIKDYSPFPENKAVCTFIQNETRGSAIHGILFDKQAHKHRPLKQQIGLLVHEAVHVVDNVFDDIGEINPGKETKAYLTQFIVQNILTEFLVGVFSMSETEIIKILQKEVTSAVNNAYPVKYLNINFEPPASKWLEIVYIPNNIEDEFLDTGKTFRGILRLVLHVPQDGKGIYEGMTEIEKVAEHFKKGTDFFNEAGTKVKIVENPNVTNVIEESPELLIPLTIRYQCFKM